MFFIKNNQILKISENKDLLSEGVSFGYGIFETIKIKNKKIIFLDEHLERLKKSLKKIDIRVKIENENIKELIDDLLFKNNIDNCAIKIMVLKNGNEANIIISNRKYGYSEEKYKNGFHLLETDVRKSTSSIIPTIKSTNYMENMIERNKAILKGYDDSLFLNDNENIAETSIANIFLVKNKIVYTPNKNQGILLGIVRQKIIDILKLENIELIEKTLDRRDLFNADEIFITNSLLGVMPVSKVNNINYDLYSKSLTNILRNKYIELEEQYD